MSSVFETVLSETVFGLCPTEMCKEGPQKKKRDKKETRMTVGFLYGIGAETLIFATGTSRKELVPRQKNQSQWCTPRKPRKIGVWVSGAEVQSSAVDTRTAVWVSSAEKNFKINLGETRNFSRKFRVVSTPACIKTRPLKDLLAR